MLWRPLWCLASKFLHWKIYKKEVCCFENSTLNRSLVLLCVFGLKEIKIQPAATSEPFWGELICIFHPTLNQSPREHRARGRPLVAVFFFSVFLFFFIIFFREASSRAQTVDCSYEFVKGTFKKLILMSWDVKISVCMCECLCPCERACV